MRMGQRKKVNNTHKKDGKEDGEETPADLKGQLMGTATGVGWKGGGYSKNKEREKREHLNLHKKYKALYTLF